jgi:micrococcal nuclease
LINAGGVLIVAMLAAVVLAIPAFAEPGTIVEVTDGDTVKVSTGAGVLDVRVLGIDTPEVYDGEECWGSEASAFAERILAGKHVQLRSDPTQDQVDRYGRALRYIILADGQNYSILAAEAGVARSYVYLGNPVQLNPQIVAAENRAQAADKGLWGPPCNGSAAVATTEPGSEPVPNRSAGGGLPPPPPDLDCSDISGPVRVAPGDPHRLDADGDGIGCEG